MPFCPECKAEYRTEIQMCPECQVELVPEQSLEDVVEYVDWEVVRDVPSEMVGNLIQGVLEAEGIEALVRPHEIGALGGARLQPEWGEVRVHRDDLERAKQIVEAYTAIAEANSLADEDPEMEEV